MVLGLFSKERSLKRTIEKANNQHVQSPDRYAAMEKLRDNGSEEALIGLCRRFSFACHKTIEDEQEKEWVVDTLVQMGDKALPAVRRYMKSAVSIAYPLRVVERIAPPGGILEVIDELLTAEQPGYTRDPMKRMQVIEYLAEWKGAGDADIVTRLVPYLADFDENVRFKTVDAIAHHMVPGITGPLVTGPLVTALVRPEEESRRLRVRIAEILAQHELPLGDAANQVAPLLADMLSEFRLQQDRLVAGKK
jgi:hypothetical protein